MKVIEPTYSDWMVSVNYEVEKVKPVSRATIKWGFLLSHAIGGGPSDSLLNKKSTNPIELLPSNTTIDVLLIGGVTR